MKTHPPAVCACTCVYIYAHSLTENKLPFRPASLAWLLRPALQPHPPALRVPPPPPTWPFLPTLPHFVAGTTSDLLPRPGSRMQGSGGSWEAREASDVHGASIQVLVVEGSRRGNLDKRKIQGKETLVLHPRWDTGRPAGAHCPGTCPSTGVPGRVGMLPPKPSHHQPLRVDKPIPRSPDPTQTASANQTPQRDPHPQTKPLCQPDPHLQKTRGRSGGPQREVQKSLGCHMKAEQTPIFRFTRLY